MATRSAPTASPATTLTGFVDVGLQDQISFSVTSYAPFIQSDSSHDGNGGAVSGLRLEEIHPVLPGLHMPSAGETLQPVYLASQHPDRNVKGTRALPVQP